MQIKAICSALAIAAFATAVQSQNDVRFDINQFQVEGNTLLPQERVNELVAPFTGKQRVYGDVQKALEALENAYRKAGYGTVQVFVPEQELNAGMVKLVVSESVIGSIALTGNKHFSEENIRASLPALKPNQAPNLRELSENIQLTNDNPAKQVEVTLGIAEDEGKVNAAVKVTDQDPSSFIVTADNTGTPDTGRHRIGLAYRYANLFDSDHVLSLAITGSPDLPDQRSATGQAGGESARNMSVTSIGYRLPFYSIGDSMDFVYGRSNVNTPTTLAGLTGQNIIGDGEVFLVRWNHYLPRQGEYSSRIVFGYDHKNIQSCVAGGCTDYVIQPASVAYVGQRVRAGELMDYNVSVAAGQQTASLRPRNIGAPPALNFTAFRLNASYLSVIAGNWTARAVFNAQYSPDTLPDVEKYGLVGSTAVRGFFERSFAGDTAYVLNLEMYTPEYAQEFNLPGSLKFVGFLDGGRGYLYSTASQPALSNARSADAASIGVGFRYSWDKSVTFRTDVARVLASRVTPDNGAAPTLSQIGVGETVVRDGDVRGHFNLMLTF